jgi:hypothetical protein|tara:strand:- start:391 stop:660 length:270 start_codon:yes stop_codon:yes gene_type:complete
MGNTLLYKDTETGGFNYFRFWDGSRGSLTVGRSSLKILGEEMRDSAYLFEDPFDLEGGIPDREHKNIDSSVLRPLNRVEISQILEALRG